MTRREFGELKVKELIENGAHTPVTKENKHRYMYLFMKYYLIDSINEQFKAFKSGFNRVCNGRVLVSTLLQWKPPIKDTLKEDKPLNKGLNIHSIQNNLQKRTTSLQRTKGGPKCVHYYEVPLCNDRVLVVSYKLSLHLVFKEHTIKYCFTKDNHQILYVPYNAPLIHVAELL